MMGTIRRKHLFIPAVNNVDVEVVLKHIHRILVEVFDSTLDNVVVVLDQTHQSVSVIFDNTWTCRIYLNDNLSHLLLDQENWVRANGAVLTDEDCKKIAAAFPRLDIFCDPDENHDFDEEFVAMCLYLQLNLMVQYSYDPIQGIFTVYEVEGVGL